MLTPFSFSPEGRRTMFPKDRRQTFQNARTSPIIQSNYPISFRDDRFSNRGYSYLKSRIRFSIPTNGQNCVTQIMQSGRYSTSKFVGLAVSDPSTRASFPRPQCLTLDGFLKNTYRSKFFIRYHQILDSNEIFV